MSGLHSRGKTWFDALTSRAGGEQGGPVRAADAPNRPRMA